MEEIKCAVYTRKSTDEGLEKEFNTLEAQREAGENYVKSQKHQGWVLIKEHYDDGGFSGGNMNRPSLKRLLQDVEAGKVNMIVVYKIDRLTRSLTDFAKMVDIFDKYKCSFVSVTQNFYTLWTLVAFEDLSSLSNEQLISKLTEFYEKVSEIENVEQEENDDIRTFYINSIGAATETDYRRNRHNALKHYLLG